jgi:hypothetical protein
MAAATFNQKRYEGIKKIIERVRNGEKVLVDIIDILWDDGYLEKGMKAYITKVGENDIYEGPDGNDEILMEFEFEFSKYSELNKSKEGKHYSDGLTASEVGEYPENDTETCHISLTHYDIPFTVANNHKKNNIFQRYLNSGSKKSYTSWLEFELLKAL